MVRKIVKGFGIVLGIIVVVGAGLVVHAKWRLERSYADVPEPQIHADTSPAGLARGELLFQSLCIKCHGGPDGRATGQALDEIPSAFGHFWSANLAHPQRGVRKRSDGQIARVMRQGVLPDGQLSLIMGNFNKLGDADIAAILGYMRSDAPAFAPAGVDQPRSQPSLIAAVLLTYVMGVQAGLGAEHLPVPEKRVSVEYGRYMAQSMDCLTCHTDGFAADKLHDPGAFAGGSDFQDPTGTTIYSKNITFDRETGIGRWSLDDFQRAVTRGTRPDGFMLRGPMPIFSLLDRTDVAAIYTFLGTMPKVHRANTPGGHPLKKAKSGDSPETLFTNLGCVGCHGENAPHRDKIANAVGKSDSEVAQWILDPQAVKPGVAMPSFAAAIDRAQAESLARYVKALARERGVHAPEG